MAPGPTVRLRGSWRAISLVSLGVTSGCGFFLEWEGYVGHRDTGDGGGSSVADAAPRTHGDTTPSDGGAIESDAGVTPDGALAPGVVPCGDTPCVDGRLCCIGGSTAGPVCRTNCAFVSAAITVQCDSRLDCGPGQKCCAELDGGALVRTTCAASCPGTVERVCDPAYGDDDCQFRDCRRAYDAGALTLNLCD